jgi:hypothetical protein
MKLLERRYQPSLVLGSDVLLRRYAQNGGEFSIYSLEQHLLTIQKVVRICGPVAPGESVLKKLYSKDCNQYHSVSI